MKLLTKDGMKCISKITTNDVVINENSSESKVTSVVPIRQLVYSITMQDGTRLNLTDQVDIEFHIARSGYKPKLTKIAGLLDKFNYQMERSNRLNIKATKPITKLTKEVDLKRDKTLLIDPYTLGVVLGDGCITQSTCTVTSADYQIISNIESKGYACNRHSNPKNYTADAYCIIGLATTLRKYDLIGCNSYSKFIPADYISASVVDRYAIVQGLMDTDGYVDSTGRTEYCTISPSLRDGLKTILHSLGFTVTVSEKYPFYRDKDGNKVMGQLAYNLYIRGDNQERLFRLDRKLARIQKKSHGNRVDLIESLGFADSFSITTDSDLAVLSEGFIPVFLSKEKQNG